MEPIDSSAEHSPWFPDKTTGWAWNQFGNELNFNDNSTELCGLMEDKEIASRAVAFVVNSTRKGIVPLCADVANLMRSKQCLEKKLSRLKRENGTYMTSTSTGSVPGHSMSPTPPSLSSYTENCIKALQEQSLAVQGRYRSSSRCSNSSSAYSYSPQMDNSRTVAGTGRPLGVQCSPATSLDSRLSGVTSHDSSRKHGSPGSSRSTGSTFMDRLLPQRRVKPDEDSKASDKSDQVVACPDNGNKTIEETKSAAESVTKDHIVIDIEHRDQLDQNVEVNTEVIEIKTHGDETKARESCVNVCDFKTVVLVKEEPLNVEIGEGASLLQRRRISLPEMERLPKTIERLPKTIERLPKTVECLPSTKPLKIRVRMVNAPEWSVDKEAIDTTSKVARDGSEPARRQSIGLQTAGRTHPATTMRHFVSSVPSTVEPDITNSDKTKSWSNQSKQVQCSLSRIEPRTDRNTDRDSLEEQFVRSVKLNAKLEEDLTEARKEIDQLKKRLNLLESAGAVPKTQVYSSFHSEQDKTLEDNGYYTGSNRTSRNSSEPENIRMYKKPCPRRQAATPVSYGGPLPGCKCSECLESMGSDDDISHYSDIIDEPHRYAVNSKLQVQLDDHVITKGSYSGHIRYVGHVDRSDQSNTLYIGLELDSPVGQHDGYFLGKRYFCCKKNYGIFVPINDIIGKVNRKVPFKSTKEDAAKSKRHIRKMSTKDDKITHL